jgi:hypothetical protein
MQAYLGLLVASKLGKYRSYALPFRVSNSTQAVASICPYHQPWNIPYDETDSCTTHGPRPCPPWRVTLHFWAKQL